MLTRKVQNSTAIYCDLKLIPWNLVNLSHLYFQLYDTKAWFLAFLIRKPVRIFFFSNVITGKYQVCPSEQNKRSLVTVAFMNSINYLEKLLTEQRFHTKPFGHMVKLLPAPWSPSWSLRRIPLSSAPSFVIDSQFSRLRHQEGIQ